MASVTYYVVQAFDEDAEGNLIPRQPQQASSAGMAERMAVGMSADAAGVIAFSRSGDIAEGEYTAPTIIYQAGRIPDELE